MESYGFRTLGILITSNVNHFKDLKTFIMLLHPQSKTITKILQNFSVCVPQKKALGN